MGKTLIEYEQGELYQKLVDDYEVFDHLYEVLVFLAVVGYREGVVKRTDYKGDTAEDTDGEAGLQNVHSRDLYHTVAACLAFQDTDDPQALVDPVEHKRVIAQYAAGGLEVAQEKFGENAGDPTDAIVSFIKARREEGETKEETDGQLEDILAGFDDEMMGYD